MTTEQVNTNLTYEQLGILADALAIKIEQYERNALKYRMAKEGNMHYVPNYYKEIYLPTKNKMEEERQHYISLRKEIRNNRKVKKT